MEKFYVGLTDFRSKEEVENVTKKPPHHFTTFSDCTYTVDYEEPCLRPVSEIKVCSRWDKISCESVKALWDTGSFRSCISEKLVKTLDLHEIESTILVTPTGNSEAKIYRVYVRIADIYIPDLKVVEYPLKNHDVDFLIGMDIISQGKFVLQNLDGKTQLTFTLKK